MRLQKNRKLLLVLSGVSLMSGCAATARLYPVEGPLSIQKPTPVFSATLTGRVASGNISLTIGNGEICKGRNFGEHAQCLIGLLVRSVPYLIPAELRLRPRARACCSLASAKLNDLERHFESVRRDLRDSMLDANLLSIIPINAAQNLGGLFDRRLVELPLDGEIDPFTFESR
jgi:hypothetical protein